MTKEEAELEEQKGNYVTYEETESGKGYRRIIASPKPIDIYEIDSIRTLVDAGQIVIAAGGGGIPVLDQRTGLKGASAVIEKDYTAAKLADMIDASTLLILTSKEGIRINKGTENEQFLGKITIKEAENLIEDDHFNILTSLPKVEASINFVSAGENRRSIITSLDKAKEGVLGKSGTVITK